ncbi:hypothetical protein OOT00_11415 [Desulfobotulus sp. H1]|uniref:Uncharacterized protein n=1 Tax=Desulfobotulus pelophilus TaxID=2823377 RepID=A0ABT3NCB7_9BACT|nr:hypothetical protein [Desulfobotulus pelophilus]MCW7754592.1 hypothetical protein [Desulfobotulus pelophilus]
MLTPQSRMIRVIKDIREEAMPTPPEEKRRAARQNIPFPNPETRIPLFHVAG